MLHLNLESNDGSTGAISSSRIVYMTVFRLLLPKRVDLLRGHGHMMWEGVQRPEIEAHHARQQQA